VEKSITLIDPGPWRPPSVVFQHTHHFLVQHQELSPEPPNDFAYWVATVLQEDELGERLAAVDTVRFANYPVNEPWLLEPARTVAAEPI
jgi:hypothetical protein